MQPAVPSEPAAPRERPTTPVRAPARESRVEVPQPQEERPPRQSGAERSGVSPAPGSRPAAQRQSNRLGAAAPGFEDGNPNENNRRQRAASQQRSDSREPPAKLEPSHFARSKATPTKKREPDFYDKALKALKYTAQDSQLAQDILQDKRWLRRDAEQNAHAPVDVRMGESRELQASKTLLARKEKLGGHFAPHTAPVNDHSTTPRRQEYDEGLCAQLRLTKQPVPVSRWRYSGSGGGGGGSGGGLDMATAPLRSVTPPRCATPIKVRPAQTAFTDRCLRLREGLGIRDVFTPSVPYDAFNVSVVSDKDDLASLAGTARSDAASTALPTGLDGLALESGSRASRDRSPPMTSGHSPLRLDQSPARRSAGSRQRSHSRDRALSRERAMRDLERPGAGQPTHLVAYNLLPACLQDTPEDFRERLFRRRSSENVAGCLRRPNHSDEADRTALAESEDVFRRACGRKVRSDKVAEGHFVLDVKGTARGLGSEALSSTSELPRARTPMAGNYNRASAEHQTRSRLDFEGRAGEPPPRSGMLMVLEPRESDPPPPWQISASRKADGLRDAGISEENHKNAIHWNPGMYRYEHQDLRPRSRSVPPRNSDGFAGVPSSSQKRGTFEWARGEYEGPSGGKALGRGRFSQSNASENFRSVTNAAEVAQEDERARRLRLDTDKQFAALCRHTADASQSMRGTVSRLESRINRSSSANMAAAMYWEA